MQGQTSQELHQDGGERSAGKGGPEGVGGRGAQSTINPHDPEFAGQRALDKDEAKVGRGGQPDAQDRLPESAETVATENKLPRN
jgi:hypothetical protein